MKGRRGSAFFVSLSLLLMLVVIAGCRRSTPVPPTPTPAPTTAVAAPTATSERSTGPSVSPLVSPAGSPLDATGQGPRVGITGEVQEIATSARVLTLEDETRGVVSVAVTDQTQVRLADGEAGSLDDLSPGDRVEVVSQPAGAGPLVALGINLLE